jgi:predicted esterase
LRKVRPSPGRFNVSVDVPFDFQIRRAKDPKGLALLMHGYGQSGAYMFHKLAAAIPEDFTVLAPNAPFPLYIWDAPFPSPGWRERKVRMGYTWYFYDSQSNEYFVDMEPSLQALTAGLKHLGVFDLPATVIGFSQGGYVSPFIAALMPDPRQVIGVSCDFLSDDFGEKKINFRADAIFGDSDKIANIEAGKSSHEKFLADKKIKGEFHVIPGLDHEINSSVSGKIKEIGFWNINSDL